MFPESNEYGMSVAKTQQQCGNKHCDFSIQNMGNLLINKILMSNKHVNT